MNDVNLIKHASLKPHPKGDLAHPAVGLQTSVDDALVVATAIRERIEDRYRRAEKP